MRHRSRKHAPRGIPIGWIAGFAAALAAAAVMKGLLPSARRYLRLRSM